MSSSARIRHLYWQRALALSAGCAGVVAAGAGVLYAVAGDTVPVTGKVEIEIKIVIEVDNPAIAHELDRSECLDFFFGFSIDHSLGC